MAKVLVAAQGVEKVFRTGDIAVHALRGVELEIGAGEFMAIVGPSGGGKSTGVDLLLRHLDPDEGEVRLDGHSLRDLRLHDVRVGVNHLQSLLSCHGCLLTGRGRTS